MLLNTHTYFSLHYGTLSQKQLLDEVKAAGYDSMAITDINNTSACIDIIRMAADYGIHPVVGIDFRNGIQQQYIGLAKNNEGFRELNEHLTQYSHTKKDFPAWVPDFDHAFVIYPFGKVRYENLRSHEFVGIKPCELNRLAFSEWRYHCDKLVILQPVTFIDKKGYSAHRLLRAIGRNMLLSRLPVSEQAQPDEMLPSRQALHTIYKEYPEIIRNTERVLSNCHVNFEFGVNKNKKSFTVSLRDDYQLLRSECEKGLAYRYGNPGEEIIDRMEKELKIIEQLGFGAYFLINWDIIRYAQRKKYPYVGRGSGANSIVAYLLRITDVDPIELDLYFERFINPFRTSPPDFDIDFSWTDRDDITRYIFERHGYSRVALLGAYITFQHKAVLREIGKVFGLPSEEISRLQRNTDINNADRYGKWVICYSDFIAGFPSHLSVHSSGILISDQPVSNYSSTHLPPKGFATTHFDMQVAEDVGLYKFDILSQRGLGKIKDSLEIIRENKGADIDIHDVHTFKKDERVKQLLRKGQTIACFYVESPAMRMLLTKLRADDYIRLVAASSIIRPGVAKSGMMREYILRYRDKERREKAQRELPELYKILEETYGVMVYQEDVIKVAHYFAGLTLAEADVLRRGMSWKFRERNEFWKVKDKFFTNCKKKGYPDQTTGDIWGQIESFANYAFSKGHSASYAVESYQAMYLKAYYPLEYLTATLNNGGGFYQPELYVHEVRMNGGKIELPCVNNSDGLCKIKGNTIYLGFHFVQSLETSTIEFLLIERWQNGSFTSLRNFIKRTSISLEQLILLIRIGAFRFTGKGKKELLWDAHFLLSKAKRTSPGRELFDVEAKEFKLPELYKHPFEDAFDEIELLGFPIRSPFDLLERLPVKQLRAADLKYHVGRIVSITGYLIHVKTTLTSGAEKMHFGVFLDLDGHWLDTVHFPPVARRYPFQGPGCYEVTGKVMEEFEFVSVEVTSMRRLPNVSLEQEPVRHKPADRYNRPVPFRPLN